MPATGLRWLAPLALCAALSLAAAPAETDLDVFMRQVVAQRDDNWKKLQQYIFDERESFEMRGTNRVPIWGERREYTWFIRDGFFVRSPFKVNGVDGRRGRSPQGRGRLPQAGSRSARSAARAATSRLAAMASRFKRRIRAIRRSRAAATSRRIVGGVLRQTREPQFISSAYFLRFKFEEGKYALVGRETLDGRDVLRIEYYPARMFGGSDRRRTPPGKEQSADDKARDAEFQRMMNKVALVTLWIEPKAHQIVKYTFDNVGFDFLPLPWLVHVSDFKATMTVGQPFPDVWLPTTLSINIAMTARGRAVRPALRPRVPRLPRARRHQQNRHQVTLIMGIVLVATSRGGSERTARPLVTQAAGRDRRRDSGSGQHRHAGRGGARLAGVSVGMPFDATTVDAVAARLRAAEQVRAASRSASASRRSPTPRRSRW